MNGIDRAFLLCGDGNQCMLAVAMREDLQLDRSALYTLVARITGVQHVEIGIRHIIVSFASRRPRSLARSISTALVDALIISGEIPDGSMSPERQITSLEQWQQMFRPQLTTAG